MARRKKATRRRRTTDEPEAVLEFECTFQNQSNKLASAGVSAKVNESEISPTAARKFLVKKRVLATLRATLAADEDPDQKHLPGVEPEKLEVTQKFTTAGVGMQATYYTVTFTAPREDADISVLSALPGKVGVVRVLEVSEVEGRPRKKDVQASEEVVA